MTIQRASILEQPAHYLEGADFQIIVPEESTNLIANPSFETSTANWTAAGTGVTLTRDTAESFYGASSGRMSDASATGANEYIQTEILGLNPNTSYTLSFNYKKRVTGAWTGTVYVSYYNGLTPISSAAFVLARGSVSQWKRASFTSLSPAGTTRALLIFSTDGVLSGAFDLWLDGVQFEAKPYATTYIDGEQDDCVWIGAPHGSSSYRLATTRKGGRPMKLSDYKFRVISVVGAGAAALTTVATPYANIGGGYYQRSVAQSRTLQIVGAFECRSQIDLMRSRAALIDAVNPNRTSNPQPARLLYTPIGCSADEPTKQVVIDGVYAGGLEGNQTNEVGVERAVMAFNVYLPFAAIGVSMFERAQVIDFVDTVSRNYLIRRDLTTGAWNTAPTDPNGGVTAILRGEDGYTYVGGHFTNIGGRVAKWDNALGYWSNDFAVAANDSVYALARGFAGDVFIGGDFTTFDGGAANRIVRHRGGTTYSMGAGTNGTVYAIAVAPDGTVYAGGDFTTAGGGAASNIARWNGSAWTPMGAGLNSVVTTIAVAPDGTVYAGGAFTGHVAKWNGSAWSIVGGGVSGGITEVNTLAVAPNGALYVGGVFTTAGTVSANNIVGWSGAGWFALGVGTDYGVNALRFAPDGVLHVGGAFGTAGGLPTNGYAEWNGSVFIASDQDGGPVSAIEYDELWMWLGYALGSTGVANTSGLTTIAIPANRADLRMRFLGPGRVTSLRNWTTGARMYFDLDLQPGEIVTLTMNAIANTRPMLVSSARGDITSRILPSSSPSANFLNAGTNRITVYVDGGDGNTSASAIWRESYQSLDEVVR